MHEIYHVELDQLTEELVRLAEFVKLEMGRATEALLDADLVLAERVITDEAVIGQLCEGLDDAAVSLLALQQPVATDLRLIVAGLRISADLERMGRLARQVAELVRRRHPTAVVPAELRVTIARIGQVATRITTKAIRAADIERDEGEMGQLQQRLYQHVFRDETAAAMDISLIGRYYERYADHALSIAARITTMQVTPV